MSTVTCNVKQKSPFKVVWNFLLFFIFFVGVLAGPVFIESAYATIVMSQGISRENDYDIEEEPETEQIQFKNNISMAYSIPKISTLLTVEEGMVYGKSMMLLGNWKIYERRSLILKFSDGVTVTNIDGIPQKSWKTTKTSLGTICEINYNGIKHHINSGNYLTINFSKEISGKSPYELPSPIITGIDRVDAELAIEAKENILIKEIKMEKGRQVDARELSFSPSEQILFAYKYTKEINLGMEMEKPKEVPVLTGTIDSVNAVSVMSAHGKILTRVLYQIKTNQVQYFTFTLPKAATLFSASVNGVSVKPMTSADGETLVPLKNIYGDVPRNVEIIYYTVDSHSKLAGNMKNILPKTVFPASELLWSVYLPLQDKPVLFGGNLEKIDETSYNTRNAMNNQPAMVERDGALVPLQTKEEMQTHGQVYRKDKRIINHRYNSNAVVSKQYALENDILNERIAPHVSQGSMGQGVLPVTFHIPERGALVRFSGFFLMEEHPQAQITYVGGFVYGLIKITLIVLAGLFLLVAIRKIYPVLMQKLSPKNSIEKLAVTESPISSY